MRLLYLACYLFGHPWRYDSLVCDRCLRTMESVEP